jgi:hypothetical protein
MGAAAPKPGRNPAGFQEALLAGDHSRSAAWFEEGIARSGDQILTAVRVLQLALYEIGRKWQCNAVSVTPGALGNGHRGGRARTRLRTESARARR